MDTAYSIVPTGPAIIVSDKTQGNSKRIFHLFIGLGMALVNHNYLIYFDLKTSLGFTTPFTCFSRNSLFFMLYLMLHRR